MPAKRYPVILDRSQRDSLLDLIASGTESARKLTRGRILLKADEGELGPAYADKKIKEAVEVSISTIERTRKTFALEGLTAALTPKKRLKPSRPQKFDGEKEAHLIALACSPAPEGFSRWTLRLLAEKMVELNHVSSVCHETIRRTLKKHTQALAKAARVYSPESLGGVRRCDGKRLRPLSASRSDEGLNL